MAKDESKEWAITTDGKRPLAGVAKDLLDLGFAGLQVLDEIGVITGSATDKIAAAARRVRGVKAVEPSIQHDVGPPDSPITW